MTEISATDWLEAAQEIYQNPTPSDTKVGSANTAALISIATSLERIADSLQALTTATVAKAKSAP